MVKKHTCIIVVTCSNNFETFQTRCASEFYPRMPLYNQVIRLNDCLKINFTSCAVLHTQERTDKIILVSICNIMLIFLRPLKNNIQEMWFNKKMIPYFYSFEMMWGRWHGPNSCSTYLSRSIMIKWKIVLKDKALEMFLFHKKWQ